MATREAVKYYHLSLDQNKELCQACGLACQWLRRAAVFITMIISIVAEYVYTTSSSIRTSVFRRGSSLGGVQQHRGSRAALVSLVSAPSLAFLRLLSLPDPIVELCFLLLCTLFRPFLILSCAGLPLR